MIMGSASLNSVKYEGSSIKRFLQFCRMCLTFSIKGGERSNKEEASDEDEDTEYFDAMEDSPAFITVTASESSQHRSV